MESLSGEATPEFAPILTRDDVDAIVLPLSKVGAGAAKSTLQLP
jgi:hypothetical protein